MKKNVTNVDIWLLAGMALFVEAFIAQVVTQRFMFADGANFLIDIMVQKGFTNWDYPRQYAHYVTQWPVALAIALSVRNVTWLATLYGASLFSVPLITLAVCAWLAPRQERFYLLLPLFGFAYVSLNGALFIISESHLSAGCFFVLLFFVALCRRPTPGRALLAALTAVAAMRIYESFSLLGLLMVVLSVMRLRRDRELSLHARAALVVIVGCGIGASLFGFYWMLFSERNLQKVGLGHIVMQLITDPNTVISSLLALAFALPQLKPTRSSLPPTRGAITAAAVAGLLLGLLPLTGDAFVPAVLHYPARVLNIIVPLGCALLLLLQRRGPTAVTARVPRTLLLPLCTMLVWNATWQTVVSGIWWRYIDTFTQVVRVHRGVVPLASTPLEDNVFNVGWTLPSFSILLPAIHHEPVEALIEPMTHGWQPFNPRVCTELPNLTDYGVTYGADLRCKPLPSSDF